MIKDLFETEVIFCEHCSGSGRWETHRGLENCPKCKGLGEIMVIRCKIKEEKVEEETEGEEG